MTKGSLASDLVDQADHPDRQPGHSDDQTAPGHDQAGGVTGSTDQAAGHGRDDQMIDEGRVDQAEIDHADQYEQRIRHQKRAQLQRLKDESRAIFGMVEGRPGVRSLKDLQNLLEKAGDEIGNGRFIVRYLGAERYLDVATVAVLITLRQNLIAEAGSGASAADIMLIDTAVVAYYNFLRVQSWIGNLSLVVERELFGETLLSEIHGPLVGDRLRDQLERLTKVMLPLQDRAHRMIIRALERLTVGRKSRRE